MDSRYFNKEENVSRLIAYDICGVQPMQMPTGLIFAMKPKYSTQGGTEAESGCSGYSILQYGTSYEENKLIEE